MVMCLAFPAKVLDVGENSVLVEAAGEKLSANSIVDKLKKGDYVLVQQGFVVEKLTEQDAQDLAEAWEKKKSAKGKR